MVRVEKCSKFVETFPGETVPLTHQHEGSGPKSETSSEVPQRPDKDLPIHPDPDVQLHSDTSEHEGTYTPPKNEVNAERERVLKSKAFAKSPRLRHILAHILTQWAEGNINRLDGYNIAIDVFRRDTFFDSGLDPIVRVEIARLRKQLVKYYETEAQQGPLRIEIPKGRYIPVFHRQPDSVKDQFHAAKASTTIFVLVLPFTVQGDRGPISLYDNLLFQLTREPGIRVASRTFAVHLAARRGDAFIPQQSGPHFLIEGCASCVGESYYMILHLSDNLRGYNVWSGRYTAAIPSITEMLGQAVKDLAKAMHAAFLN